MTLSSFGARLHYPHASRGPRHYRRETAPPLHRPHIHARARGKCVTLFPRRGREDGKTSHAPFPSRSIRILLSQEINRKVTCAELGSIDPRRTPRPGRATRRRTRLTRGSPSKVSGDKRLKTASTAPPCRGSKAGPIGRVRQPPRAHKQSQGVRTMGPPSDRNLRALAQRASYKHVRVHDLLELRDITSERQRALETHLTVLSPYRGG